MKNPTRGQGFERFFDALERPTKAQEALLAFLVAKVRECFEGSVDPWGGEWAPQSAATIERRTREGKPLGFSHLADRITSTLTPDGVRVGAGFDHARRFQFGGSSQPGRPFLPAAQDGVVDPPPEMREAILRVWAEGFRESRRG